jgi:pSer/pThr/pTyr-binding forkhead associated (FHA) protein
MAVLIGMSGLMKGKRFDIEKDEVVAGRGSTCDVRLDDSSVSSRHCAVRCDGNKYSLADLGSTNGTRVNGVTIQQTRLKPKDIIQAGNVELMFDGPDVDIEEAESGTTPTVEVVAGPAKIPDSFRASSPFGKRKDTRKPWLIVIGVLGVAVLAALVFFVIRMLGL